MLERQDKQIAAANSLLAWAAQECQELATQGTFLKTGPRCRFCLHALPDGDCRLRRTAERAKEAA